jgi:hypothetical protein
VLPGNPPVAAGIASHLRRRGNGIDNEVCPRVRDAGKTVALALARHAVRERGLEIIAGAAADVGRIQEQERPREDS